MRSSQQVKLIALLLLPATCLSGSAGAQSHSRSASSAPGVFGYYLLTLSWSPEFCATHAGSAPASECGPGHRFGFVVHGLWPQNENGPYPRFCAPASPVAHDTVQRLLAIMPDRSLIQHEWSEHGTCSGLDAQSYFATIEKAFANLQIPPEYRASAPSAPASPAAIEQEFAGANHAPPSAFRIACSGSHFVALQVCLTKDLQYRQCGSGLRDCRAPRVDLRPPH
ncbi:MAG TPA: ribonuclease T2 [Candidatus Binatia bacterium]|nr:ribonuclease T2 [Candidatus Binatia bacterium]